MNRIRTLALALVALTAAATTSSAQLGRQQGLVEPNVAAEKDLLAVPNMTPAIVKGIMEKRPFLSILDLNTYLTGAGLSAEQLTETYRKMFIHVNLNVSPRAEILLIPGAGPRFAREFDEYKPYTGGYLQFRREMGKYIKEDEVARLEQYTFIPIDLNKASEADILSLPGVGEKMLKEFKEYRPWASIEQFRREIGKYVNAKEVARLERYVSITK